PMGVQRQGLRGKTLDFHVWEMGKRVGRNRQGHQPSRTLHYFLKMAQGGIFRIDLERHPGGLLRFWIDQEQAVNSLLLLARELLGDLGVKSTGAFGANTFGGSLKGGERWQFVSLADELLNGNIDQINQVVFTFTSFT